LLAFNKRKVALIFIIAGIAVLLAYILFLWISLQRPPLRTLGETRLIYSFLLTFVGLLIYFRWRYSWLLLYSLTLAIVFIVINILKPETHQKELMPALQSIWFVPHVIVYMLGYAILGVSSFIAIRALVLKTKLSANDMLQMVDNTVYVGFAFLTMGLLFGAYWAKQAWGHYWTWDPKETWALLTWLMYLIYMHFRFHKPKITQLPLWILALSFIILLFCWFGINYLPAAQNSVHVYTN